jgi:hypothetical protein
MDRFLLDFAATIPANTHALRVLDGAGWHDQRSVTVPPNVTLVELPPYSPDLNLVERVWLYLSGNATSSTASWPTTTLSSTPAAEPGTPSRPKPAHQIALRPSEGFRVA